MSRRPRGLTALVAAGVALALLVVVGRWEARRHADAELRDLARTRAAVGPLDQPTLVAYRWKIAGKFDCLIYRRGNVEYALELCFDAQGRLVEAIDRRRGEPKIASLREDPGRSTIRADRPTIDRLLKRLGAPP